MFFKSITTTVLLALFCLTGLGQAWGRAMSVTNVYLVPNIYDGNVYKKARDQNPRVLSTFLPGTPPHKAKVTLHGTARGNGWVYAHLTATIDGTPFNRQKEARLGITPFGTWIGRIKVEAEVLFNKSDGNYSANASGRVTAIGSRTILSPSGSLDSMHNPGSAFDTAVPKTWSWEVKTVTLCPSCKKEVSYFTQHSKTCSGCGSTIWTCTARKLIAANSYGETDGWQDNNGLHWQVDCSRCRQNEWHCARSGQGTHRDRCSTCNAEVWTCSNASPHTCTPTNGGGGGGNTVSNNGGGGGGGGSDTSVACPAGSSCRRGGRVSSTNAHRTRINSGCNHYFYSCISGERAKHVLRTCSRCNRRYTRCGNWGPCRHNRRIYTYHS